MTRTHHHGWKQKQRKFGGKWWCYLPTPSWWVKIKMTRPQRRKVKLWERATSKTRDFETVDKPPHGKKPHIYYW